MLENWQVLSRFNNLNAKDKRIVFYSEGPAYWVHLEPLVRSLVEDHGVALCYLSSNSRDPGLFYPSPLVKGFCIGDGTARTWLFRTLDAGIMVMTMPDLETFHIKRSAHPVRYVYVHHSIVSTHMIYRPSAFDLFDAVFCVGPHHIEEIRARETLGDLPTKYLVPHGYGRLDSILETRNDYDDMTIPEADGDIRVLVAPSWGTEGLLETHGVEVVKTLIDSGFQVTVRPHPQTRRLKSADLDSVRAAGKEHPNFFWEEDVASLDSLHRSHIMISDWSGAALEFAFGLERPVLFIDVPRKVNNSNYQMLGVEPLEAFIRDDIGMVVAVDDIGELKCAVRKLVRETNSWTKRLRTQRQKWVFNVGKSGSVGAQRLLELSKGEAAKASENGSSALPDLEEELRQSLLAVKQVDLPVKMDDEEIVTLAFLRNFSMTPAPSPDSPALQVLERLCRKVDIAKKVCRSYGLDWVKPVDRTPMEDEGWPLLVVALLRQARSFNRTYGHEAGIALKLVNTAFNALEAGGNAMSAARYGRLFQLARAVLKETMQS